MTRSTDNYLFFNSRISRSCSDVSRVMLRLILVTLSKSSNFLLNSSFWMNHTTCARHDPHRLNCITVKWINLLRGVCCPCDPSNYLPPSSTCRIGHFAHRLCSSTWCAQVAKRLRSSVNLSPPFLWDVAMDAVRFVNDVWYRITGNQFHYLHVQFFFDPSVLP